LRGTPNHRIKAYAYSPWGATAVDTGYVVRQRFGGAEYDQETGLYRMGARYYDPALGRFLSEDPAGTAGGLNLYQYAAANPISQVDPAGMGPTDGMSRCDPEDDGANPNDVCYGPDGETPDQPCYQWSGCRTTDLTIYAQRYAGDPGEEAEYWSNLAADESYANQMIAEGGAGAPSASSPSAGPSCRDALLLLAGSAAVDVGSFASGGLEGIVEIGRGGAALLRARALSGAGQRVVRQIGTFMIGHGAGITGMAYVGSGGVGIAGTAALNVGGTGLATGSFHLSDLWGFVPVAGTLKALWDAHKTCPNF
jgi:RHS repeat-associated protein